MACQILQAHPSRWVEPTLVRLDVDADRVLDVVGASEDPIDSNAPAFLPFQELISLYKDQQKASGQTIFVIGSTGQGKSRLAAEVAAALLRSNRPCIFFRRQEVEQFRDIDDPQRLAAAYMEMYYGYSVNHLDNTPINLQIPFIIDGWNEIEEFYADTQVYRALNKAVSGPYLFPVLMTSRRLWWQSASARSFRRKASRTYRLETFSNPQRNLFIEAHGLVVPTKQMTPFAASPSGPTRCPLLRE
jgi:hypothetical protein